MTNPMDELVDAAVALREAWAAAGSDVRAFSDHGLTGLNDRLCDVRRRVDAAHVSVAAELARRSRPELGRDGLARKTGFRTPVNLIAAATGGHAGDAARLIAVGEATRERETLTGDVLPPKHPHIARALAHGALSVAAAAVIAKLFDRMALRVDAGVRDDAERVLVEQAASLTLKELESVLCRLEATIDPDGVEPRIAELRAERSLKITHDASGMVLLNARLDPESAAPVVAVIQGIVTHQLRVSRGRNHPEHGAVAASERDRAGAEPGAPLGEETRSLAQMNADALSALARHVVGCDQNRTPGSASTVIVRMDLDQIRAGANGIATIDGIEQPIDAASARRMAAAAGIIPAVLGTRSEILDFGREKRAFTRAQRAVYVERDGGCAGCHLPPAFAEAHHLTPWSRGGTTDLDEGILLCTGCHHRVHDDGWEIRIERPPGVPATVGIVWFIPPPHVDPTRTPRRGGRARYDPLAWHLAA